MPSGALLRAGRGLFSSAADAGVRGGGARQNLVCGSARERRQGASRHLPAGFVGDTCFGAVEIAADIPARQGLVIAPPRHPMMQRHANLLAGKLGFEFRVDLPGEADGKRRRLFEYRWPAPGPIGQGARNPTRRQAPFRFWIGFVRRRRIWRHLWRFWPLFAPRHCQGRCKAVARSFVGPSWIADFLGVLKPPRSIGFFVCPFLRWPMIGRRKRITDADLAQYRQEEGG